jgi:hypothetical protein
MDRLTPCPAKKKNLNNTQGTEKEHAAEGVGYSEPAEEGGRARS